MTHRHRLLVVEDDAGVRELVVGHLEARGFLVQEAASGEAVLQRLRRRELDYDVALVDVHLPGLSGLVLNRLLVAAAPLRPVVLITGDDDEDVAQQALLDGATGYLLKPFQLFELDAALAQALSILSLVETTETLARARAAPFEEWGEAGGLLPRSWLRIGDARSDAGTGHGARVVSVAAFLARRHADGGAGLTAAELERLRTAARTHEIGRLFGAGGSREVARRSAQLLDDLGFDPTVGELVRQAVEPWSPALSLPARLLALADRLDHRAVAGVRAGLVPEVAIRGAVDAVGGEAGQECDPDLCRLLTAQRDPVQSMWILQRRDAGD